MSVIGIQITVDDTLGGTNLHVGAAGVSGSKIVVKNDSGTDKVSLGPPGVTFAAGFQLAVGATINIDLSYGDDLVGICAAAKTAVVHILKAGE